MSLSQHDSECLLLLYLLAGFKVSGLIDIQTSPLFPHLATPNSCERRWTFRMGNLCVSASKISNCGNDSGRQDLEAQIRWRLALKSCHPVTSWGEAKLTGESRSEQLD